MTRERERGVPAVPLLSLLGIATVVVVGTVRSDGAFASAQPQILFHVLLAMTTVIALSQLVGGLFVAFRQPAVVGEMVAGILLGPSFFRRLAPREAAFLLPASLLPSLRVVAQLGVVLFMFLVGLHLDGKRLGMRARTAISVALVGIAVPLVVGAGTAFELYPLLGAPQVGRALFACFFSVAMSVTAFPVLARIVAERSLAGTPLGLLAIACAAMDDAMAWCLLAFVAGFAKSGSGRAVDTLVLMAAYLLAMFALVRPMVRRLAAHVEAEGRVSRRSAASLLLLLFLSALSTEGIGIHALFGAFLLGALVPSESLLARNVAHMLEDLVGIALVPIFFAFTGFHTEIALLDSARDWWLCGLVVAIAFVSKLGGVSVSARLLGMNWRTASALGVLMNTRGLMELIVLDVGRDLGIVPPKLFTMMVLMAIVTTVSTGPLLDWIGNEEGDEQAPPELSEARAIE